ncbi:hypothetical protein BDV12DRAFT_186651 [Aspergillus spectabilis]
MSTTPAAPLDFAPSLKRRKIRKGTTSCWDCKRRKVRCSLVDNPNTVCTACRRRGTKCVTQDHPEEAIEEEHHSDSVRGRAKGFDRVVDSSPSQQSNTRTSTQPSTGTPHTGGLTPSTNTPVISEELYASLPSLEDVDKLLEAGAHVSIALHALTTTPSSELEQDGSGITKLLLDRPTAKSHPVQLARYLFHTTTALQHLDYKRSGKQILTLSVAPQFFMKRLSETAIRLVTKHDDLIGTTVEGLECVLMEGNYHLNCGNLRPAWIAFRRALGLAQLMGIHRLNHPPPRSLDPRRKVDTAYLWYRIVYIDRMLCLLMGLPQGSMDRSMAADTAITLDTPIGRLERTHCVITSRILERHDLDLASFSTDTVQEIDNELQKAAEMMPSGWWVAPSLAAYHDLQGNTATDEANDNQRHSIASEVHRLTTQLTHYALINYLHIPLMLNFTTANPDLQTYSQTSCITASREILSRHNIFRAFNRTAYSSRLMDLFTISAILLLLVAHLKQHTRTQNPGELNPMLHQRQTDRAMVEQAVKALHAVSWVSLDSCTAKAADMLGKLLAVEAEARKGAGYRAESVRGDEDVQESENKDDSAYQDTTPSKNNDGLRFCIPYFGTVRIVPDTTVSRDSRGGEIRGGSMGVSAQHLYGVGNGYAQDNPAGAQETPWYAYAGFTGAEDWVFQGLDMTIFDSLLRGSNMPSENNILRYQPG